MTWDETCRILEESHQALSRTLHGVSYTHAATNKRPLLLSGEELARQSGANARALYELLRAMRDQAAPCSAEEVSQRIRAIEDTVNRGLLPAGRFREWDPSYADTSPFQRKVPWAEVPRELEKLERELFARWSELAHDPVPVAAWLEWSIQGPLHPYYDGCGCISRGLSAWILTWADHPVPRYQDREEWFRRAGEGLECFTAYVRECSLRSRRA